MQCTLRSWKKAELAGSFRSYSPFGGSSVGSDSRVGSIANESIRNGSTSGEAAGSGMTGAIGYDDSDRGGNDESVGNLSALFGDAGIGGQHQMQQKDREPEIILRSVHVPPHSRTMSMSGHKGSFSMIRPDRSRPGTPMALRGRVTPVGRPPVTPGDDKHVEVRLESRSRASSRNRASSRHSRSKSVSGSRSGSRERGRLERPSHGSRRGRSSSRSGARRAAMGLAAAAVFDSAKPGGDGFAVVSPDHSLDSSHHLATSNHPPEAEYLIPTSNIIVVDGRSSAAADDESDNVVTTRSAACRKRIYITTVSHGYYEISFDTANAHSVMIAFLRASLPPQRIMKEIAGVGVGVGGGTFDATTCCADTARGSFDMENFLAQEIDETVRNEGVLGKLRRRVNHIAGTCGDREYIFILCPRCTMCPH